VIRRLPNSLYPIRKNPRHLDLLKVRKEKHNGEHGEAQVEAGSPESMFVLFRCL
jgi:hypothetical protein